MGNKLWKQKDGSVIKMSDMTDTHLANAIKLLEKTAKLRYDAAVADAALTMASVQGDMASYYADQDYQHLTSISPLQFLAESVPAYEDLIEEQDRRKYSTKGGSTVALPSMEKVTSSNVESVGFDEMSDGYGDMYVKFQNGRVYKYTDVERETYLDMIAATSVGSFFNREIKGNYNCVEISGDAESLEAEDSPVTMVATKKKSIDFDAEFAELGLDLSDVAVSEPKQLSIEQEGTE